MGKKKQKLQSLKSELDQLLGDEEAEKAKDIVSLLEKNLKELKQLHKTTTKLEQLDKVTTTEEHTKEIVEAIKQLDLVVPDQVLAQIVNEVTVKNLKDIPETTEVKVSNLKDIDFPEQKEYPTPPSEVKISNLKEIAKHIPKQKEVKIPPAPDTVDIKKPKWWDSLTAKQMETIITAFSKILVKRGIRSNLDEYRDANRPIAVRLSDGRKFIDVLTQVVTQAAQGSGKQTYITKVDEATATITYIGKAMPGTAEGVGRWQIARLDSSTISVDKLYADGTIGFNKKWSDRAGLNYS